MKSTLALSSATLLCLASAFPLSVRQADQVNIVLQTGDGDSAQAFDIDIGKIIPTSQSGGSSGVDASIGTAGVTCQAFKDAAGTTPLDSPFTSANAVFFNQCGANGDATSCVLADAVAIGAYCCAENAAFTATCLANVKSNGGSGSGNVQTVTVQFANDVTGTSGIANIPLDGSSVSLGQAYRNTHLFKDGTLFVTSLQFTGDSTNVACEVLKNEITKVASIADPRADFQTFSKTPLNWETGFTINCTLSHSA
ncbi:hypothetical protein OIDMADRAFT_52882 [Oidiodendron maius Zn]|uniref:Uncharacterized protein n=1 Tax=Oidiodendron maius (strain Zn) TaxID=913774 RepID=A0A0C3CVP4_OIDMZ|nr:hypothetical protein OIDMADRAFT_52882 [Oidiodendron maius Zn]